MTDRDRRTERSRGELEATARQDHREAERIEPPRIREALDACSDLSGHREAARNVASS
jgi:hypothetical protein